jgi:hypothetical protein
MAIGTSVCTDVPCVLAGMQRGSSVRSHQRGGAVGVSLTCPLSPQPSAESWSQAQSAARADAASNRSIAATANTGRGFLM